jgi:peptide/nickel transport system substrate-binding protein
VAGELVSNMFSSLVQFDVELGLVPDLAENWTVSEDGLTYSFALRDGLTFHNGDPLKAADIVYTYERTIDPDLASPHANKLALVESVDTPDDLTVNFT